MFGVGKRILEKINDGLSHLDPTLVIVGLLITVGFIIRTYNLEQLAGLDYDQKTAAWWIKSLLVDRNPSLLGQETSVSGVFIGPLYFYFLAPFYFLFRMDPIAANVFVSITSVATMILVYKLSSLLFSRKVGVLALLLYSVSFPLNFYDRTTAPSNMIMLVTLASTYLFFKAGKDNWQASCFLGFLLGLTTSIHPTAVFLIPILLMFGLWTRKSIPLKHFALLLVSMLIPILPLVLFEFKHSFLITHGFLSSFSSRTIVSQDYPLPFKLIFNARTLLDVLAGILTPNATGAVRLISSGVILTSLVYAVRRGGFNKKLILSFFLVTLTLLSFYSRNVPEYYFLLLFPFAFICVAQLLVNARGVFKAGVLGFIILSLIFNLSTLIEYHYPVSMYFKKQAVKYIIADSAGKDFAVDLEAAPGQNNGFDYLFFLYQVTPSSQSANRYAIIVPADYLPEKFNGKIFGGIKVVKKS